MTKKKRNPLWLNVDGNVNTLRRHMINAGYRPSYETTIAKRYKCKPSEIPLEVIREHLGENVEVVGLPSNWQEIMYGSPRGAKKNSKVSERSLRRIRRRGKVSAIAAFLSMQLSANPRRFAGYY